MKSRGAIGLNVKVRKIIDVYLLVNKNYKGLNTELQNTLDLLKHLNEQSEFLFSNLTTWFIFYCTLNATFAVSGYLGILNSKNNNQDMKTFREQLLYWASTAFQIAGYLSIIGLLTLIAFFLVKIYEIQSIVKQVNSDTLSLISVTSQHWTFIIITVLFIFVLLLFVISWNRIRKKNDFETLFKVLFKKMPFKKNLTEQ